MKLYSLIEHLSNYNIELYGNKDLNHDIYSVKFLSKKQNVFNDNTLYLCPTEYLPPPDTPGKFTILCYGTPLNWTPYKNNSFSIVFIEEKLDDFEIFNKVQDIFYNINNINKKKHILMDALLANKGLQYLVDVAYEVFGNPLFIIDNSYRYLAVSSGVVVNNPFIDAEIQTGYIHEKGIEFIRKSKIDEKIRKKGSPVRYYNPLHDRNMMAYSIKINDIEVARIMLYELNHPFNEFDETLLRYASRIFSIELQKDSFITSNKGFMYSYFFADLLDNPYTDYTSIEERLTLLGYNLKDAQYILTIPPQVYHDANINPNIIAEQIRLILTGSIYAIYHNTITILLSCDKDKGISEYDFARLSEYLKANKLVIGMSSSFTNLKESKKYFNQALKAVELGLRIGPNSTIYRYSDYYIYHLLEICSKEEDIRSFIHPGVMKLFNYDKENNTDFLKTLNEYLKTPGQTSVISKRLHIHKNTLIYRMNRIQSIIGCNIEIGDELLSLELSLRIMEYLKMI